MSDRSSEEVFRSRLAVEIRGWERDKLIDGNQASAILSRYYGGGAQRMLRAFRLNAATVFISLLGAAVLGAGVILFFAANWTVLPSWSKAVLVFGATGTAYAAGYIIQFRWRVLPRLGASLIVLGAILFQAGLFLLAQIYNLPVDNPIMLLLGAAGILPLAYVLGAAELLLLGLADALGWVGWVLEQHYPNTPESYAVPLAYILLGIVVYALGHLHELRSGMRQFSRIYSALGLLTILIPVYVLTFGDFWRAAQEQNLSHLHIPLWFTAGVLVALAAAGTLGMKRWNDRAARLEVAAFGCTALAVGLVAAQPQWAGRYPLLFNLLFFGIAVLVGVRGYIDNRAHLINISIPLIALGLMSRYFDMFYSQLGTSSFFMVGGALLLAVGAGMEWLRRRLLSSMAVSGSQILHSGA
ncbi:MAG TPA: DUF2157 domain-containing protein [Chloroflexota bacterium]